MIATAIHNGHFMPSEVGPFLAIGDADRLREEDPFTGQWARITPNSVVVRLSRFAVDMNRPREKAVYLRPEDAWGLRVWKRPPPQEIIDHRLAEYDAFRARVHKMLSGVVARWGRFVLLDIHSYNHLRDGPGALPLDPALNPSINIGTGTLPDRAPWAALIDGFIADLQAFDFPLGPLDVRENVKFKGGAFPAWIHGAFPGQGCVLSVEVKKFFMDEWTGEADFAILDAVSQALQSTLPGLERRLLQVDVPGVLV